VLQERSFTRIGGKEDVHVDIRILSATNKEDLKAMVDEGTFREDLYYRLNVFAIRLPPLRERREDIPLLVDHFIEKLGGACRISDQAMALLLDHRFPGNVRELWNVIERASILCRNGTIGTEHLPPELLGARKQTFVDIPAPEQLLPLKDAVRRFERDYIQRALQAVGGSRTRASDLLGIGRKALWERLKR
jgi:DNA-binding NtrC family response regulator